MQPGRFADPLRHRHDPARVEDQDQRQLERPNEVEQHRRFVRIGIDQALSRLVRDTPPTQFVQESAGYQRRECRGVAARRKVEDGAILGHDAVNETQIAGDPTKLVENPSGHEQDRNASRPGCRYRLPDQRTHRIIARRGSVVVQRQH